MAAPSRSRQFTVKGKLLYEADSSVPLVANSPPMSFLHHYPAPEYRHYMNKEGEVMMGAVPSMEPHPVLRCRVVQNGKGNRAI